MSQASFDSIGEFFPEPAEYFKALCSGFEITASLVVDKDGLTVNSSGNSKGIGNAVDLALLIALRKNANLVLTSGLTFRNEAYKMPKNADLAVFSRKAIDFSGLEIPEGRDAIAIGAQEAGSYLEALDACLGRGYKGIHIEFGERGIMELFEHGRIDALFISSLHPDGLERFLERMHFSPVLRIEIQGLNIGLLAWQQ